MTNIEVARKVAAEKQAHLFRERKGEPGQYDAKPYGGGSKRGWMLLDGFTASAICLIFDKLNPENQAKLLAMPLTKVAEVAFKLLK